MKLSKDPCRVVGVRAGEVTIVLFNPDQPHVEAKFILLRSDGTHSGQYSKASSWGEKATQAFEQFITALEEDVVGELFDTGKTEPQEVVGDTSEPPQDVPSVPTLGDKKGVHQI